MDSDDKKAFRASFLAIPAGIIIVLAGWALTSPLSQSAPPKTETSSEPAAASPGTGVNITTAPESPSTESPAALETPNVLFLEDLSDDQIVTHPKSVRESSGTASIAGTTYLNSLIYEFSNCSECEGSFEFIVPAGYTRLTGTVGLSDKSRHDDVIDGVVNFAVYDAAGNQLLPTVEIEYPGAVPIDIDISGQPRIRLEMSRGTNYEQFVLGDAALSRPGA